MGKVPDTPIAQRTAYVMSDSTGGTAMRTLQVALEQFPQAEVREMLFPNVRSPADVARVMHMARETNALVIFTIVDLHLRETARTAAKECGVVALDLLEPVLSGVGGWLGMEPVLKPGHPYDEKYFKRMAAIDFVQLHDDGKNSDELPQADVVVLGLSRVSKTPVCNMLAGRRIRAANVPIVLGIPLPPALENVDPRRVFVLHKEVKRLIEVRESRLPLLGDTIASDVYVDEEVVRKEVVHVLRLLERHPQWTRIDMGRIGVEDAAAKILAAYSERFEVS